MNFTHLIILKKKPWFIYSTSQEDAVNIATRYGDDVVGVVLAPEGLIMQEVHTTVSLVSPDIKLLDKIVECENADIVNDVLKEDVCLEKLEAGGEALPEKSQNPTTEPPQTTT